MRGGDHFTEKLLKCQFEPLPGWECLFSHRELKLILSVYVDDFKLVGRTENMETGWDLITGSGLFLDPPVSLRDYLGCGQFPVHVPAAEAQRRLDHVRPLLKDVPGQKDVKAGRSVKAIRYDMLWRFTVNLLVSRRQASERLRLLAWTTTC